MDSKSPEEESFLEIASNIWTTQGGGDLYPYEAAAWIPGDLRVSFSDVNLDNRVIRAYLNLRQYEEYIAYKFFLTNQPQITPNILPIHPLD